MPIAAVRDAPDANYGPTPQSRPREVVASRRTDQAAMGVSQPGPPGVECDADAGTATKGRPRVARIAIATPGKLGTLTRTPEQLSSVAVVAVDDADGVLGRSTFAAQTAALFNACTAAKGDAAPRNDTDLGGQAQRPQLLLASTTVPVLAGDQPRGDRRQGAVEVDQLLCRVFGLQSVQVLCCGNAAALRDHHSTRRFMYAACHGPADRWWHPQLSNVLRGLADAVASVPPERPRQIMIFTARDAINQRVALTAGEVCPHLRVARIQSCRASTKEGDARDAAVNRDTWCRFVAGAVDVLVCSDIGAVGLDTSGVWAVVSVGVVPRGSEFMYAHRAGRCGRQVGSNALVVTLVQGASATSQAPRPQGRRRSRRRRGHGSDIAALKAMHERFTSSATEPAPAGGHHGPQRDGVHIGLAPALEQWR